MGNKIKANRLSKMKLDEVSHVRRGANQLATNVIWKSDDYPVSKDDQYGNPSNQHSLGGNMPNQAKGNETQAPDLSGLTPEVASYIESLQKNVTELNEALEESTELLEAAAKGGEGDEDADGDDDTDEDEALSKADDQIKKQFADMKSELKKAQDAVKAERDVRLNGEYIRKAAELDKLPVDSAKFGPVLKSVAEKLDPAEFEALWSLLSGANEAVKKSAMFGEIGKSTGVDLGGASAVDVINKSAETLMAGNTGMSREQAVAKALELKPELYIEYTAERNAR